jgi:hypothetical protein
MSIARLAVAALAASLIALAALLVALPAVAAPARIPKPGPVGVEASSKASYATIATATAAAQAIAGPGVTVTNATWRGEVGIGTFGGANALLGIDSGIVMTTGFLNTIFRPNAADDTSDIHDFTGLSNDAQLDAIVAPNTTFDATVLEFDVTTSASTINIRYVFASEEYNEFVDSPYNDVFGFFVNGVNCARIGAEPISVNTVNAGRNGSSFIDNTSGARQIEFDGLTVVLTCTAQVTPNVPNHVKLAIADVSDPVWDAAVFIAAGGITSGGAPVPGAQTVAVEYLHAGFGHYFITAQADEIAGLDSGVFAGWARTGQTFNVWTSGTGLAEVCRFFTTYFAPKSSHFYTANGAECALVGQNPVWQYEKISFLVALPGAGGNCPVGIKLYRLYNNGQTGAPNHRYTTSLAIRAKMIAQGFSPEDDNIWCVPG